MAMTIGRIQRLASSLSL